MVKMHYSEKLQIVFLFSAFFLVAAVSGYASDFSIRSRSTGAIYVFVDNDTGNFGIGTSSPTQKLEINGNLKFSDGDNSRWIYGPSDYGLNIVADSDLLNSSASNAWPRGAWIWIKSVDHSSSPGSARIHIAKDLALGNIPYFDVTLIRSDDSSDTLFKVDENMAFFNRNLGIGTSSPSQKLEIYNGNLNISYGSPTIYFDENDVGKTWLLVADGSTFSIREDNTSTGRFIVAAGGNVGIDTYTPLYPLEIHKTVANEGWYFGITDGTRYFRVGRDDDITSGVVMWLGSNRHLWVDVSGNLRYKGSDPTYDTDGTAVGTQTSSLDTKNIIKEFTDNKKALDQVIKTPLFNFTYKNHAFNQSFIGLVTDYSPIFGMDRDKKHPAGKSLNVVTTLGYLIASIKELNKKNALLNNTVQELKQQNDMLKQELCAKDNSYSWC